ncbi:MAG: fluoride efflux transporter CrcB [Pseudomonadota bacterium]
MSYTLSSITASGIVAAGGALGAVGRYQLGRGVTHWFGAQSISTFPWATLTANIIGSLAMGLLFGWLARHGGASETARLFFGVGLLGGFTTFSAFSLEMLLLIERGSIGLAMAYATLSVLAGLAALYLGLSLIRVAT